MNAGVFVAQRIESFLVGASNDEEGIFTPVDKAYFAEKFSEAQKIENNALQRVTVLCNRLLIPREDALEIQPINPRECLTLLSFYDDYQRRVLSLEQARQRVPRLKMELETMITAFEKDRQW